MLRPLLIATDILPSSFRGLLVPSIYHSAYLFLYSRITCQQFVQKPWQSFLTERLDGTASGSIRRQPHWMRVEKLENRTKQPVGNGKFGEKLRACLSLRSRGGSEFSDAKSFLPASAERRRM